MKKISCDECQKNIEDYISNNLSENDLELFIYHVKDCPSCKEELSINYSVITALDQLNNNVELSEDYDKELDTKIKKYVDRKRRKHIIYVAVSCLMFIAGIFIGIIMSVLLYNKPIKYSKDENANTISFKVEGVPDYMDSVKNSINKYNNSIIEYLQEREDNE